MKKISDPIEPISEETAKEANELFNKIGKSLDDSTILFKTLESIIKQFAVNVVVCSIELESNRFINYCFKVEKATFITRWYWKIKFDKSKKRLEQLHESLKELEKININ